MPKPVGRLRPPLPPIGLGLARGLGLDFPDALDKPGLADFFEPEPEPACEPDWGAGGCAPARGSGGFSRLGGAGA